VLQAANLTAAANPDNAATPRFKWTDEMVECLLDLRLNRFKDVFQGSKSNAQIGTYWTKITLLFNRKFTSTTPVESQKLRDKYCKLKVQAEEIRTTREEQAKAREEQGAINAAL